MQTATALLAPSTATNTTQRDIYREVTDKIIAMIEKGVAPWRRTWSQYGLARDARKHSAPVRAGAAP